MTLRLEKTNPNIILSVKRYNRRKNKKWLFERDDIAGMAKLFAKYKVDWVTKPTKLDVDDGTREIIKKALKISKIHEGLKDANNIR